MKEKVKNFTLLLLLFSIFLGIFLPFQAEAFLIPPDIVVSLFIDAIASGIIVLIAFILDLAYGLLLWIISEDFLGVSMTGPDNPFVYGGWTFVRDLANIFLVLGLIVIALAIILGIKDYEAKKTLPILIIIALLINFTPVICGAIIDFSHSLMFHLLKGGFSKGFVDAVLEGLQLAGGRPDPLERIVDAVIYIIFGLISIVVILLYCGLFLLRYVFLWILVIFSPIAFASRIFGGSKYLKMLFPGFLEWDNWWSSFIQWCIIGIFAAFFLFLTNRLMTDWLIIPSEAGAAFLGELFMHLFPLLLLGIGFFVTIEAAQEGMKVLPAAGKALESGKKMTSEGIKKAKGTALVKKTGERIRRGIERISETYGTERMKAKAEARHRKKREERIEAAKNQMANMSLETAEKFAQTPEEKIALFKIKIERGKLKEDDLSKENIDEMKKYGISEKDLLEAAKRRPDYAQQLTGKTTAEFLAYMSPEELRETTQADALKNLDVYYDLSPRQVQEIMRKGNPAQQAALAKVRIDNSIVIDGKINLFEKTAESQEEAGKEQEKAGERQKAEILKQEAEMLRREVERLRKKNRYIDANWRT